MKSTQILAFVLAFSSLSAASLDMDTFGIGKALGGFEDMLHRRQDGDSSASDSKTAAASASASGTGAAASNSAPTTGDSSQTAQTGKETGKETGKATGTGSSAHGTKTTTKTKATTFDPESPAGGITMLTPAATLGEQFYRVGDWVTFVWNYTSLSVTPSAIDILATCTSNKATYTLAVNQTIGNGTGELLWDTGAFQSSASTPLIVATYTLIMYDADSSVSAAASPGYLSVYNQFTFGIYTPQPYTPFADFHCPTCSGGSILTATERQTLGFLLIMGTITVLSFTWFANGFGIF